MLSFHVTNLIVPGDPQTMQISTPSGSWTFIQHPQFARFKAAMGQGQCAETYFLEHPASPVPAALADQAFDELTPILLGASYATGLTVTVQRSSKGSQLSIMHPTEHWPRARALDMASPVVDTASEFRDVVEAFVASWPSQGQSEKARLLVHHWLDALACWSMEDLYLSATTLLQVIVATEADRQRKSRLDFYPGVTAASRRMGMQALSANFKNMRNELIHDGRLIGHRFPGPDKMACAAVVCEVMNWLDDYIHKALALGTVRKRRFRPADFMQLNAYSID